MRRLVFLLAFVTCTAFADVPYGYQQITSLSSSTALTVPTATDGTRPSKAVIRAETQAVRWRDDGTAPTATIGIPLGVADVMTYEGDLTRLRFIEQAASAKLNVSYYK